MLFLHIESGIFAITVVINCSLHLVKNIQSLAKMNYISLFQITSHFGFSGFIVFATCV